MPILYAGYMIKEHRNAKNITLEKLSTGICDPSSLRRIEKGERTPSIFVFMKLMERLGLETDKFYLSVGSKQEIDFFNAFNEIESLIMDRDYDAAASKMKLLEMAARKLKKGEGEAIREQMRLALLCGISHGNGEDPALRRKMIQDALRLTLPNFSELKISEYMLSFDEISLLNMLASTYKDSGDSEKKIDILYQVKESMDKYYHDEYEKSRGYSLILYNLSNTLGLSDKYYEALNICELAVQCCLKSKRLHTLPYIKFNMACALFYTGSKEDYKSMAINAICALRNNEEHQAAEIRRRYAEKHLGIVFPFET